jgi:hypothetical protein
MALSMEETASIMCHRLVPDRGIREVAKHTATHRFSKCEGYRTAIATKLYDGKSGKKSAANDNGTGDVASKTTDKVAPNSPVGTPATSPDRGGTVRNGSGRTDEQ